jgi:hypothetical protein
MTNNEIVEKVRKLFDGCDTPGQAFDTYMELRRVGVQFDHVVNAILRTRGSAERLGETKLSRQPGTEFECQKCGISRDHREYCQNPACDDFQQAPRKEEPPGFKNPIVTFGRKHNGKTLTEIGEIDPGYLVWLSREHVQFWREQALMAMAVVSARAPGYRDTDATGYFDESG